MGSALIGLDQNLQLKSTDGRWGGKITPGFVERFGQAYDIELQHWVDAAKAGTIDGPSAWDGYAAVAVCEAGVLALRSGVKVHVHLAGDSSVASPEAEEQHAGIQAPDLEGAWP
jgi:myo-inositol 2-dehydrogenase/D-chiro-inositol 1-dehydrogenase